MQSRRFRSDITDEGIDALLLSIAEAPTPGSEIYVLQLAGAVADVADEAAAYTGRRANFYWLAQPIWDDAADDDRCIEWGRTSGKLLLTLSMAGNYDNEQADAGTAVAFDAYGPEKYQRLARPKTRFDPDNMFCLNQNITPLT